MVSGSVAYPIAALVLVAYYAYRWSVPRLRTVPAGPPTIQLRDEPPAVVNLLVNRVLDAPQAASATLLDLAARRILEIHQVADEPEHTLVRVAPVPLPADAPAFERRVYERVSRLAGTRLTPVPRLVEAYATGGWYWQQRLVREVVLAARRRGLVAPAEPGCALALLTAGLVSAAVLAPLVRSGGVELLIFVGWLGMTMVGSVLLAFVTVGGSGPPPDRLTAAGRAATAHWLGVAAWLRGHEPLRDLPPGAVAIWDRYLAYGAALNTSPHAVRVLDFETVGRHDELWSTHTGQRRQVRVRYPRRLRALRLLGRGSARASLVGGIVGLLFWPAAGFVVNASLSRGYLWGLLLLLAVIQFVRSGYRIVRSALDLERPVTLTGTVLDITVAGQQRSADNARPGFDIPDLPTHYYVVVDDGSSDVLRPWLVNRDLARGTAMEGPPMGANPVRFAVWHEALVRPFFQPGDRVRLTGERRSRFVTALAPARVDTRARTGD